LRKFLLEDGWAEGVPVRGETASEPHSSLETMQKSRTPYKKGGASNGKPRDFSRRSELFLRRDGTTEEAAEECGLTRSDDDRG
jgi:hypothetical protein